MISGNLTRVALLVLVAAILATGCAITSGSTFESVADAEEAGSTRSVTPSSGDGSRAPLQIVTRPEEAGVFLDGRYRGSTPLDVETIEPGTYLLTIEKDGYYEIRRWIEIPESGTLYLDLELDEITGFLDADVRPAGATIRVDGDKIDGGFAELALGSYTVVAELFGYRRQETRVTIREDEVTAVSFALEPAPFEVEEPSAWRRAFSPENPGRLGSTLISYRVSAPGDGTLVIRDDAGRFVREIAQGPYATWEQGYRWDATDGSGSVVPDGVYTVELGAIGDDGRVETATTTVTVDRSLVVRYRSIWSAAAGSLYAPTLDALPAGQAQFSTQVAGMASIVDGDLVLRFPGRLGARIGLGAGFELFAYGGFIAHSEPLDDRGALGGAVSWDGLSVAAGSRGAVRLGAGLAAGGSYRTGLPDGRLAGPDTQASFPGLFVALPLAVMAGATQIVVAPEYRATAAPIVYGSGALPPNSWGNVGYLRTAVVVDLDRLTLGASAAVRTERFASGFGIDLPFQSGLEAHWFIPESSVVVSGLVAAEIESASDFYAAGGLGIGILF